MDVVEGLTELDEFDALFDLHPDDFVAGRDALVKQLRSEKRRDAATAVAKLRRPSVGLWAINVAARRNPALVERLGAAGAAAVKSQNSLLTGGTPGDLQAAIEKRRTVVGEVLNVARAVLDENNVNVGPLLPVMRAALETISMSVTLAEVYSVGRLESLPDSTDLTMLGFGGESVIAIPKPVLVPAPVEEETADTSRDVEVAEVSVPPDAEAVAIQASMLRDAAIEAEVAEAKEQQNAAEALAAATVTAEKHVREARLFADRAERAAEANLEAASSEVESLRLVVAEQTSARDSLRSIAETEADRSKALTGTIRSTRTEVAELQARIALLEAGLKDAEQALALSEARNAEAIADLQRVTKRIETSHGELSVALENAEKAAADYAALQLKGIGPSATEPVDPGAIDLDASGSLR